MSFLKSALCVAIAAFSILPVRAEKEGWQDVVAQTHHGASYRVERISGQTVVSLSLAKSNQEESFVVTLDKEMAVTAVVHGCRFYFFTEQAGFNPALTRETRFIRILPGKDGGKPTSEAVIGKKPDDLDLEELLDRAKSLASLALEDEGKR